MLECLRMTQHCNIYREALRTIHAYTIARGNILPTFRLCTPCGNILEPVMHKLESLAAVEHRLARSSI